MGTQTDLTAHISNEYKSERVYGTHKRLRTQNKHHHTHTYISNTVLTCVSFRTCLDTHNHKWFMVDQILWQT